MIDLQNTTPHQLADQLLENAAHYSKASEELADLLERKAGTWLELRKAYTSDSQTDKAFMRTEDGVREMRLRLLLKAKEREATSIKAYLRIKDAEARNLI